MRSPFDRLIAAYNNKVIENEEPPQLMQNMGITHGMSFNAFLDVLIETPFKQYDVHVLPQSNCFASAIKSSRSCWPRRTIDDHWAELRDILSRRDRCNGVFTAKCSA